MAQVGFTANGHGQREVCANIVALLEHRSSIGRDQAR